jgi:hypothetical protein
MIVANPLFRSSTVGVPEKLVPFIVTFIDATGYAEAATMPVTVGGFAVVESTSKAPMSFAAPCGLEIPR